ncbi:hypothetical protein ACFWRG_09740 [Micromonospora tulbaghiae]|uniref:hypothetical protein n=1 Tax=Micromonospora tulbaghiae TaxID=479978 RepID=UPI00366603ED
MDKRDILIRLLGEETVARMADRAGDGLDRFGKSLDATERDAQDLDRQIADVDDSLKQLAVAFARTSDAADRMDISKAMRRQQTELRKLTKARDLLPDMEREGTEAASGFAASFVARVGPLLARAPVNPAGAAIGAALAAGLVPTLSGVIAGAVVGGVGIGGVAGGLALAAKDSRVQAAGKQLADIVGADLEESGGRFVGPAIDGLEVLRDAWNDVSDDIDATLAASSRYVVPLARGVADFVREITPGIRQASEAAGPIIREIGQGLPRLGRAISDVLEDFSENADEGASAMRWLFMIIEGGIRVVGGMISVFAGWYRALLAVDEVAVDIADNLWGWIPGMGEGIDAARKRIEELRGALEDSDESGEKAGDNIFGGLRKAADAAGTASGEVKSFTEYLQELRDQTFAALNTELAFEQSLDDTAKAARNAKGGLDKKTEAGRQNWQVLSGLVRETKAHSAAVFEQTKSTSEAARVTERGRKAFIAAAVQMGMSKKEARDYATQLFGIPDEVTTKSDFLPDNAGVKAWKSTLSGIPRNVFIKAHFDLINNREVGMALRLGRLSEGGPVVGSGPKGVDSQPYLLAPGEHVLTAAEVDAAGGHAGVERIRSVLRGQGGQPPAMAMSGGGGASVVHHHTHHWTVNVPASANPAEVGRQVVEAIRAYERGSGKGWRTP